MKTLTIDTRYDGTEMLIAGYSLSAVPCPLTLQIKKTDSAGDDLGSLMLSLDKDQAKRLALFILEAL